MKIDEIERTQMHEHANKNKSKSWQMPMMDFQIPTKFYRIVCARNITLQRKNKKAPTVGLEPTTIRLRA